jgi:hypothetical protein
MKAEVVRSQLGMEAVRTAPVSWTSKYVPASTLQALLGCMPALAWLRARTALHTAHRLRCSMPHAQKPLAATAASLGLGLGRQLV